MQRLTLVTGVVLAFILVAAVPEPGLAQTRVDSFDRLSAPRIALPDDPKDMTPLRQLCPETIETCQKYWAYTGNFVRNSILPPRHRELIILRTAWLSRGDYIWGRHDEMGKDAGLTADEIARVMRGPDASGWSDHEAALLRAVDELHMSRFISGPTWDALGRTYDDNERREVVMIVGNYTQLSMFQNTLGAQLPPGYEGLPDER